MSSNVLPQALCTIPRNPILCRPKTLGFSAFVSRRPYPIDSARLSTSCVTLSAFGPSLDPVLAKTSGSRSFIARAESNPEGEGAVENAGESEAVVLEAAEAEAGVETDDATVVNEPRKPRIKMGDIMGILNKRAVEASDNFRPIPDLRPGDIIELKMQVQETKRRLSVYKGIIIGRQNAGIHTTIRVRRIIAGIGVEIVFPIYSPLIKEIKLIKHRKVRRAKLYYLRDKLPRFSTFK